MDKGLEIKLPVAQAVRGKEERDMGGTLKEVLLGDKSTGKEGMIPRNVFNAMARMDILPLIFFSLLIGATLSVLGDRGRPAITVISGLNDAVMQLVHWIMVLAPVGIFGLIAGRIGHAGGFKEFLPELMAVGKYSFTVVFWTWGARPCYIAAYPSTDCPSESDTVHKGHEYGAAQRFLDCVLLRHTAVDNEGGPTGK